jgi:outer membrane protein OmpA-like peptidoglycan-associated protein
MVEIERIYKLMMDNPTMEIEVSGHTDNVGSAESNKRLSGARANVVVQELVKRGIAAYRMTSAGYGFDKPIMPNTTADGRAQNRRTEFKVTKM